ncbi:endolytic transglycosylase MltG [Heyndrickxia acidicola]|uniref:Endolytic murein transglycosylase n=1 Tax=Heyndrickxia acidicola TaxID=209389 RepID=A0ABU6MJT0_9BACI|nr:endolytic transglycosylase MltG [Heyndrickxia acidicola]MED1204729.1 endolytic transglycosylase MltG [Heyndrickxia acidicola]
MNLLEKPNDTNTIRKIVIFVCIGFVLLVLICAISGYFYVKSALKPVDPNDHRLRTVNIPIGSNINTIARALEEKHIIKSQSVFKYYVKFKKETGFQAGEYELNPSMNFDQIIKSLKTGKVVDNAVVKFTIPEGWQLVQIASIISKETGYSSAQIENRLDDRTFVKILIKKYPKILGTEILNPKVKHPLEGYLFPATYSFYNKKPSIDTTIETVLSHTNYVMTKYQTDMKKEKIKPNTLLTMASLIEEEATAQADRHNIASVFYNRIKAKMPLQTDPTVLYALNKHKQEVSYQDLKVKSPYNTYINKGLPPGPIASPGNASIEAALHPAKTDYLYFLAAKGTGKVYFAKTLSEHNALKQKYITAKK